MPELPQSNALRLKVLWILFVCKWIYAVKSMLRKIMYVRSVKIYTTYLGKMRIELIPSAKRLIRSLRDVGYEFVDAVADIVDNSVEANATVVKINLIFDGEDSYLTIADNGVGMTSKEIQEALRFGSNRKYDPSNDLGRFGLGLKTASLSQCERLTVSARRGEERVRINSFCWDLDHIEYTNRWEVLQLDRVEIKQEAWDHLHKTTGTVVTWEKLGKMLGYKFPYGEKAKRQAAALVEVLHQHLGMIFHKFLAGEVINKRFSIYINDEKVLPWDPYSRAEKETIECEHIFLEMDLRGKTHKVFLRPFVLPPQTLYSSLKAHLAASGPNKWNKQQGLYIYRANRLIQAGGWNSLRTSDEHTKLARIAIDIPMEIEELFQVNVAKKHVTLPQEIRQDLISKLAPVVLKAQEVYRDKSKSEGLEISEESSQNFDDLLAKLLKVPSFSRGKTKTASRLKSLYEKASTDERFTLIALVNKIINNPIRLT